MMKVAAVLLATLALAYAEPPVPSNQYLPSNQYGPPKPPSTSYGTPGQTTAILKPNNQYGPPGAGGSGGPGNNYLPPTTGGGFGGGHGGQGGFGGGNGGYGQGGQGGYGGGNGGYDDQSEPANYQFEYHVQDPASGNDFGHEESRQGDVAQGKYFVLLPDGRRQVVEYVADNEGYKPKISYEQVNNGIGGGAGGYQNGGYPGGGNGGGNGGYQY